MEANRYILTEKQRTERKVSHMDIYSWFVKGLDKKCTIKVFCFKNWPSSCIFAFAIGGKQFTAQLMCNI